MCPFASKYSNIPWESKYSHFLAKKKTLKGYWICWEDPVNSRDRSKATLVQVLLVQGHPPFLVVLFDILNI